jgi:hypothetical protein
LPEFFLWKHPDEIVLTEIKMSAMFETPPHGRYQCTQGIAPRMVVYDFDRYENTQSHGSFDPVPDRAAALFRVSHGLHLFYGPPYRSLSRTLSKDHVFYSLEDMRHDEVRHG